MFQTRNEKKSLGQTKIKMAQIEWDGASNSPFEFTICPKRAT